MILKFPENFPWKYWPNDIDRIISIVKRQQELCEKMADRMDLILGEVELIKKELKDDKGEQNRGME
jgi:hypothetical protein